MSGEDERGPSLLLEYFLRVRGEEVESRAEYRAVHEFRLVTQVVESNNAIAAYIERLHDPAGDKASFFIIGNHIVPADVDGVPASFEEALNHDMKHFSGPSVRWGCPKCGDEYPRGEQPFSIALDGGMSPDTPHGPAEAWADLVCTCPSCGHQWETLV